MTVTDLRNAASRLVTRQVLCACLLAGSTLLGAAMLGCTKEAWVPPKKDPVYRAQITALEDGILFEKQNDFPWTNVVFTLNKQYIVSVTEVRAGQFKFIIDYSSFRDKDTGEPYDPGDTPLKDRVWRIWIEGDEGYWY